MDILQTEKEFQIKFLEEDISKCSYEIFLCRLFVPYTTYLVYGALGEGSVEKETAFLITLPVFLLFIIRDIRLVNKRKEMKLKLQAEKNSLYDFESDSDIVAVLKPSDTDTNDLKTKLKGLPRDTSHKEVSLTAFISICKDGWI